MTLQHSADESQVMAKRQNHSQRQMSLFETDSPNSSDPPGVSEASISETTSARNAADSSDATGRPVPEMSNSPEAPTPQGDDDVENSTNVTPAGKLVVVVDSHALLYQVFHAMPDMSSPSGQPVGAVHGFLRDILDIIDKLEPDFLACAFDRGSITFRNEIFVDYKAHRDPMPDDLRPQVGYVQTLLAALNIPILELDNYEADDIMATVAARTEAEGGRCLLITSDKDCRQLITPHVRLYNPRKAVIYDEEQLEKDWGIRPDQVVDFQALIGDPTDNVPGVPLIGPKLARQLLNQFETLEGVMENIDQISGAKRKENLRNSSELVKVSRQLVRLDPETPIDIQWNRLQIGGADLTQATQLCESFGFRQLTTRVRRLASSKLATRRTPRDPDQHQRVIQTLNESGVSSDSDAEPVINQTEVACDYRLIDSVLELKRLVKTLQAHKRISLDTETTSTHPRDAKLVGVSISWEAGKAAYIPIQSPPGDPKLDWSEVVLPHLQPILDHCEVVKIGQNIKYDLIVLRNHGARVEGTLFDTMVADYLLQPGRTNHGLDDLADRYLGLPTISIKELIGTGKKQISMADVPIQQITPYACQDADFAFRLEVLLRKELEASKLDELFFQVEMPVLRVLAGMEFQGISIDTQRLSDFSHYLAGKMEDLRKRAFQEAGEEFNLDSPKQLGEILFQKLGLPVIKKTRTGPSTDREVLEQLAPDYELPRLLIEYRQAAKLKGTYADALPLMVLPDTGRVHTSFMQDVAATGRLSSKDPNLQNIPVRTEEGRQIRQAFIAGSEGWKLLMADYSQIELRMLAHFCRDEALCQAFADDVDIHAAVAAQVLQIPLPEVTKEQRRRAKAINFGIIYGQGAFGLAKSLGIPRDEAAEFIESYFAKYPRVLDFMEWVLQQARENGHVETILGRRRPVEGVRKDSTFRSRNLPERIAINTVIQGSAADLIKLAMLRVDQALEGSQLEARLLLQIHDELVFETPEAEIDQLAALTVQQMQDAYGLSVPLKVDVEFGPNWDECQPWKFPESPEAS